MENMNTLMLGCKGITDTPREFKRLLQWEAIYFSKNY